MKKTAILLAIVALFGITSCTTLFGVSDTAAASSGSACAKALISLRASQKAGTLSVANVSDLTNMLTVISSYNMLKTNKDNANFKKSFTSGMVSGGSGVITNSNAATIVNLLLAANGLSNLNNNNISSNGSTVTGAMVPMLNTLP